MPVLCYVSLTFQTFVPAMFLRFRTSEYISPPSVSSSSSSSSSNVAKERSKLSHILVVSFYWQRVFFRRNDDDDSESYDERYVLVHDGGRGGVGGDFV